MTKAKRLAVDGEVVKVVGCFPDEKLLDAVSKLLDDETDGNVTGFRIIGKAYLAGDMERPVSKFHGRTVEITTDSSANAVIHISIDDY